VALIEFAKENLRKHDAVTDEASGTAPHRDVTAFKVEAAYWIAAAFATPQEYGREAY